MSPIELSWTAKKKEKNVNHKTKGSKYLSKEDVMFDEEGHRLAIGGQHQSKEANTYGGSTIVGYLCPFPILKSVNKF